MKHLNERLAEIYYELEEIAEKESINLWRLARKAKDHNCSEKLVNEIREEGWQLHHMRNNPQRMLEWDFKYKTKHAFRY